MGSVEIERVSTHQRRSDHRAVDVGASGDILGGSTVQFLPILDPRTSILFSAPGSTGDVKLDGGLSLFLRPPISHQCQQERLQRAGVQLRRIPPSPFPFLPSSPLALSHCTSLSPSLSLFLSSSFPPSLRAQLAVHEVVRDGKGKGDRDRRCARDGDGEKERRVDCLDPPEMDTENRHYKLTTLIDGSRGRDDAGRSGG